MTQTEKQIRTIITIWQDLRDWDRPWIVSKDRVDENFYPLRSDTLDAYNADEYDMAREAAEGYAEDKGLPCYEMDAHGLHTLIHEAAARDNGE